MVKLLLASCHREGLAYARYANQMGIEVRVLDCFDEHHHQLKAWYGNRVLHVPGRRVDVARCVANEGFDIAVIHEDHDFIRTALITQSLHDAKVSMVVVVTSEPSRRTMYRRCGAHHVIVATNEEQAWKVLSSYLPSHMPA